MSKVLHDYRCDHCSTVTERFIDSDVRVIECPECGKNAYRVFLSAPKLDWMGMGAQKHASPEFIDRFEKAHKQQKAIEEKAYNEHGDYGPRPGAD